MELEYILVFKANIGEIIKTRQNINTLTCES